MFFRSSCELEESRKSINYYAMLNLTIIFERLEILPSSIEMWWGANKESPLYDACPPTRHLGNSFENFSMVGGRLYHSRNDYMLYPTLFQWADT